ncbi:fructose-6-phosphate aldolase [Macrococcus sp. EM39E]|uniref:fructose-6-phosphate aldolase n=1 Tax=Macrococcus animalis TaxID=3395467 RepID=UPI0039BE8235
MELILDTANLEQIEKYNRLLPISGVTTNPSIITKEGNIDVFEHLKAIRKIIGNEKTLHVQVVSDNYEDMLKDVESIFKNVDEEVYIKIPVSTDGIRLMNTLKSKNKNVSATAIYSDFQALLTVASKVDYLIPYYNRMENINVNPEEVIEVVAKNIKESGSQSRIMAASFKNVGQVVKAIKAGSQAVTVSPDVLEQGLSMPSVSIAVDAFTNDWSKNFGEDKKLYNL